MKRLWPLLWVIVLLTVPLWLQDQYAGVVLQLESLNNVVAPTRRHAPVDKLGCYAVGVEHLGYTVYRVGKRHEDQHFMVGFINYVQQHLVARRYVKVHGLLTVRIHGTRIALQ